MKLTITCPTITLRQACEKLALMKCLGWETYFKRDAEGVKMVMER